jgi:outer membrane protein assembly factor BamD (BamD/ComL family)
MCSKRQVLFEDYYASVSTYTAAVHALRERVDTQQATQDARDALLKCSTALERLEAHERDHG